MERRFAPDPLLAVRVAQDRVVLVPMARSDSLEDNLWVLEGPAFQAWPGLAAGQPLSQVRDALLAAYQVPAATLEADLLALVEGLLERQILNELP